MKIIWAVDFLYTLYEDDSGSFILELVIPSTKNAWANYEKRVILSAWEKTLIKVFPRRADSLAGKLIAEEKCRRQMID